MDGAHVFINDSGTVTKGPAALMGKTHDGKTSSVATKSKAEIAKAAHAGGSLHEQQMAEQTEMELSHALGMPRSSDNKPFDLQSKTVGIEVKTVVSGKNDKITMSKDAVAKKHAEVASAKLKRTYTVVVDKRSPDSHKFYVRAGFGSFRLGSMTEVDGHTGIQSFLRKR